MNNLREAIEKYGCELQSAAIERHKNMDDLYLEGFTAALDLLFGCVEVLEHLEQDNQSEWNEQAVLTLKELKAKVGGDEI